MMVDVPQITHILRDAEGGLPQVLDALSGYDEEDAQAFIRKYKTVSQSDRDRVSLEEISIAAGVPTLELLATATKALFIENQTRSSIIASTSHPKVVKKTVAMAMEPGGYKDREMLHNAQGFLPIPKGSTFVSNRIQVANFNDTHDGPPTPELPEGADLPGIDDEIVQMDEFERKMLDAPK